VKPANIFLRDGGALLADFGISRWRARGEAGLTAPDQIIGTFLYMAPEQRVGMVATERTDVYAAGLVLWEACTGARWPANQTPDKGDWSAVPRPLSAPLRRALALAPEERFADSGEFHAAIQTPEPPIPTPEPPIRLHSRGGAVARWWAGSCSPPPRSPPSSGPGRHLHPSPGSPSRSSPSRFGAFPAPGSGIP
jgi:serine/threonine-protein kinase